MHKVCYLAVWVLQPGEAFRALSWYSWLLNSEIDYLKIDLLNDWLIKGIKWSDAWVTVMLGMAIFTSMLLQRSTLRCQLGRLDVILVLTIMNSPSFSLGEMIIFNSGLFVEVTCGFMLQR